MSLEGNYFLEKTIVNVAKKLGITEWSYKTEIFKETEQNCFGVMVPVKLFGIQNGKNRKYNLICKVAPKNRLPGATRDIYAKEIFVYEKLFDAFDKLDVDLGVKELVPDCVYTFDNRILVFKDMRSEEFKMYSGQLDLKHINLALKTLAYYHGLSFILQQREKFEHNGLMSPFDEQNVFVRVLKEYVDENINLFEDTKVYEKILRLRNEFNKIIKDSAVKPKHLVYGHGDFWVENILFKYEGKNPIKACLLDFQSTRLLSPAQDVLFFINTCVRTELRRRHFKEILSSYFKTLKIFLDTNSVEDVLYTEEEFNKDLQIVAPFCLIHAIFATSWWMGVEFSRKSEIVIDEVKTTSKEQQDHITEEFKMRVVKMIDDYEYLRISL